MIKLGINGFGRSDVWCSVLQLLTFGNDIQVVGINDLLVC